MKKVFSGVRPSGEIHIGNYLGAIKQWIDLQKKYDCFFMIADLHAITSPYEPGIFQEQILDLISWYLASGLNPKKSILFKQSDILEHTELCWLFNTITPVGDLLRMTQYKEKIKKEPATAGLLDYPVLQAADILLYKSEIVPVGQDQIQHIELAREIARRFNKTFGQTFIEPKPLLAEIPKVMSFTNPDQKMSKTGNPDSCLALADSSQKIKEKIKKAVVDVGNEPKMSAGSKNLFLLLKAFAPKDIYQKFFRERKKGTIKYSEMKPVLAESIIKTLKPIQEKQKGLLQNPFALKKILEEGSQKARKIAQETIKEVREKMGLTLL